MLFLPYTSDTTPHTSFQGLSTWQHLGHPWVRMVNMKLKSLLLRGTVLKRVLKSTLQVNSPYFIYFLFHISKYHIKSWIQEKISALSIFPKVFSGESHHWGNIILVKTPVLKLWFSNVAKHWITGSYSHEILTSLV